MHHYYFPTADFPSAPDEETEFRLLIMTDEYKPLIVEGEEVGDYDDTTISFNKWCMATVELWTSPKEFDAYQYDYETFCEFYKPENDDYKYVDCEDEEFTPGMNGINTTDIELSLIHISEPTRPY